MGRAPCCDKNGLKKGPWTPEEDQKLIDYIHKHGYANWRTLPKNAGLQRCGKSCRLRWTNYLRPDIKRGRFSFEEEETIIQLHSILGNKWSAIASRLPGRTDNEVKNYWNTHIRKRLLRMGIDPVTHSPRLDLLDLSSILTSLHASPINNHNYNNHNIQSLLDGRIHHQENQIPYHDNNDHTIFQAQEIPYHVDPNSSNFINYVQNSVMMEPPLLMCEASNIDQYSNNKSNSNHNFWFDQSVLSSSTPSSSPTPMNSNYSTCTDQDEKDSYGGRSSSYDMFNFEIPRVLDVNDIM